MRVRVTFDTSLSSTLRGKVNCYLPDARRRLGSIPEEQYGSSVFARRVVTLLFGRRHCFRLGRFCCLNEPLDELSLCYAVTPG